MIKKHYDAIVVGGGFSGLFAAISLKREGKDVLLLERSGALGGAANVNYVLPFMNFWYTDKETKERKYLSRGLFFEFLSRMEKFDALSERGCVHFSDEYLKIVLDDMASFYGVKVLFHSTLSDVEVENGKIESISFLNVTGKVKVSADAYIDATGDGFLFYLAGCEYQIGRENDNKCQPMTLCFRMGQVDVHKFFTEDLPLVQKKWKEKLSRNEFINPRENVLAFGTLTPDVLHLNSTRVLLSPLDMEERSDAESIARKQMVELYTFLRETAPSCENATLLSSAYEIGVRESRMVKGIYTIQPEDLLNCTKFPDAIAAGNYDMDIHSPDGSGTTHYWIPDGDFYTIPYRACVPKDVKNLWVVGRCISSTHDSQAAYRIMPIVSCIGESVGMAVSIALDDKVDNSQVSIKKLRHMIDEKDLIEGYNND